MKGCMKRIFLWTENWQLAVNCICCALLISLFIVTNPARAAPLTRGGSPEEVSNAPTHKWLAQRKGKKFVRLKEVGLTPPRGSTDMQKREWNIGVLVGLAVNCGYRGKTTEVRNFMKKSPYYHKGYSDVANTANLLAENCEQHLSNLQKAVGLKEDLENYMDTTYPD